MEPNPKYLAGAGPDMERVLASHSPISLGEALRQAAHLVLLGEPGVGKSTALQFIGLSFTDKNVPRLDMSEIRYPVLITLQAVMSRLGNDEIVLKDVLVSEVRQRLNCEPKEARALVEFWDDKLLVLLDGLDEVSDAQRPAVRRKIENFLCSPYGWQTRVVLTSRLTGFASLAGMVEFTIQPFEDSEKEALPFLTGWLAALKREWAQEAEIHAAKLLEQMQARPAMRPIMNNPLLLRLSAETYALTGEIAPNRADLYTRHVEEMWRRAGQRGAPAGQKDIVLEVLEMLAWHLQRGGDNEEKTLCWILEDRMTQGQNEAKTLLKLLEEKTGLIAHLPGGHGGYIFAHQTLREYFVARHLQRAWEVNPQRTFDFLRPRLHLPEWREPLALLAGLLPEAQAINLIHRVHGARSSYEYLLQRDILLAAHLAVEGGWWQTVQGSLLPKLIGVLWTGYCREWKNQSAMQILENIDDPVIVPYLIYTLREGGNNARQAAAEVLGEIGNPDAVDDLSAALWDEYMNVHQAAAEALEKIGPAAIPSLIAVLRNSDKQGYPRTVESPEKIIPVANPSRIGNLHDKSQWVRSRVVQALAKIGGWDTVPVLSTVLRNESGWIRQVVGEALGRICASAATPHLIVALQGKDVWVRQVAAEALGETGDPTVVPVLIAALRDEDMDVRWAVVRALGKIGDPAAVPTLSAALRDKDADVRKVAAEALGKIGNKAAVPSLITALQDKDIFFRQAAAEALGNIGDKAAALALIAALQDETANVHEAARAALERCSDKATMPYLISALRNENWRARRGAVEALGIIGDPTTIPDLSAALRDKDQYVRMAAAKALGEIGDLAAAPVLRAALRGRYKSVCLSAAWALGDIGDVTAIPDLTTALRRMRWARQPIEWSLTPLLTRLKPPTEPQECRVWLRRLHRLRRVVVRANLPDLLALIMERESAIRTAASAWQDPLQPSPLSTRQIWAGRLRRGALVLLVVGLVALIGALISPAGKVLEAQLLPFFQAQPLWAATLVIGGGVGLSACLGLVMEKMRRRLK